MYHFPLEIFDFVYTRSAPRESLVGKFSSSYESFYSNQLKKLKLPFNYCDVMLYLTLLLKVLY